MGKREGERERVEREKGILRKRVRLGQWLLLRM